SEVDERPEQEPERLALAPERVGHALEDEDGRVDDDPHDVDEVPVDARDLDAEMLLLRVMAAERPDRREGEQRQPDEDVGAVQAGEADENRTERDRGRG